jgi:hypothetical protein
MLSPGNGKLGPGRRIWSFSLPSRRTCPGRSEACVGPCYAYQLERWRSSVRRRYSKNLVLSRRRDFVSKVVAFIARRQIGVVRVHVGGDFYSTAYAGKWLEVMRGLPAVRFYFYSRSWRVPAVRRVFARMARLANVRVWFSCDRATGLPHRVPRRVRLAWLMTGPDDVPPRADLAFRLRPLRRSVCKWLPWRAAAGRALVCPVENGATGRRTTCGQCGVCWKPLPQDPAAHRLALPLVSVN